MSRALIVNADDFGLSPGVNLGVARAHEHGIVTSASFMVRGAAAREAVTYAHRYPGLSVGLHLDFGEWIWRNGVWHAVYRVVDPEDEAAVATEVRHQVDRFRALLRRDPTHLDSHQHAHRSEPARSVVLALGDELGVPVRGECDGIRYCGSFYGQTGKGEPLAGAVEPERLVELLHELPEGTTELGCHPAAAADCPSVYLNERLDELRALCDQRVRDALAEEAISLSAHVPTTNGGDHADRH